MTRDQIYVLAYYMCRSCAVFDCLRILAQKKSPCQGEKGKIEGRCSVFVEI